MEKLKNIPSLRFPEFDGEWKIKSLGEVANVSKLAGYEFTKHITYEESGSIIALRGLNIKNNELDLTDVKYIDNSELNKLERSKLYVDDLMFTYIGTIGQVALIKENNKFYLAPNVSRIRVNQNLILPKYILQFFNNDKFKNNEIAKYVSSSSQPALSMENVRKFEISFPAIQEQNKIASFLTAVDDKLQALKQKKTLFEQYKKGVMQKIFSQELRFKDDNRNEYPNWEEKKLGDCLDYIQPTKYLVSSTEYDNSYSTPVLTAGKTFILGYTNETNGIFENNLPVIIFDDFTTATQFVDFPFKAKSSAMKILIANEGINIKFIYEAMGVISYEVGGHERHWISKFAPLDISIPNHEEQTKIANFLSAIDDKINYCQSQIEKTEVWKKGLLQQMFV